MKCFTVGHSNHSIEDFTKILQNHNINCIVDVRSSPYSAYASQFNRESIKHYLKEYNIVYIFMGDVLGARYEDKSLLFDDGRVNFSKVSKTVEFQNGIDRVIDGIKKNFNVSLMCSEKDPFDCHRFVLVSKALGERGLDVKHILPDKIISQIELEERLFQKYKLNKQDLFSDQKENLEKAYKKRNVDIAYNAFTKQGDNE